MQKLYENNSDRKAAEISPIYFKTHLRVLLYLGIDIIPIENPILRYVYYMYSTILIGSLLFFSVLEFLELFLNFTDIEQMTFGLCYLVTHILGTFKMFIMIAQRQKLWNQFQKMEQGLFKPNIERGGIKEFELIKTAIKYCNLQGNVFYTFVFIIIGIRGLFAAVDQGTDKVFPDFVTNTTHVVHTKTLPYTTWCPFNYSNSPTYEILFFFQMFWTIVYGVYIGAVDALICGIMMMFKAHFLILKRALDTIIERAERKALEVSTNAIAKSDQNARLALKIQKYAEDYTKECISHHQQLLHFCVETENVFCYLMLLQFLSSLFLICFQLFQLSLTSPSSFGFISMVCYLFLMMFQILCYCWHGNEVQLVSGNVSNYIYHMNWIFVNDKMKKSLLLMMMRSQRPSRFTAGKFVLLSLQTFMAILRGSGSYFMVLRQMNS